MRLSIPNLRILRIFEAVGRLESVSGAARATHISQPAVTQAIAKLEDLVGEHLFDRRSRGTYLTAEGVALHRDTTRLLSAIESAAAVLRPDVSDLQVQALMNKITSAQLECLISIVECSSTKAAAERYRTQESSINRSVRELEKTVGTQLLRRTAGGMQMTEQGVTFASSIAFAFNEFSAEVQTFSSNRQTTVVSIGAPVLDKADLLAAVITEFADLFPTATVRVINEPMESLRLRLRSGTLDMIVGVLKPHSSDLTSEVLIEEEYHVAARLEHPLTAKQKVTVGDLSQYDWIVPNRTAPRREAFETIFANASKRPAANIETHSLATIRMTLASSNRLALLTQSELRSEADQLAAIPYSLDGARSRTALTYLTMAPQSQNRELLVTLFRKHAQRLRAA